MLQIPDVRQADDYDCGPAARDAVYKTLGVRTKSAITDASVIDGMHPATMEHSLRLAGLAVCSGSMTIADLAHHTRLGRPVLCSVDLFGGHWVVVRGVTAKRVYYHCPSEGARWVTRDRWLTVWHDSERAGHTFVQWGIAAWSHNL